MQLSYWEKKSWFTNIDYTIIGSGIVGLNCALRLRKRFPKVKILIIEKGSSPQGASTKNAGFACFGSMTEILHDLNTHSEEEVATLIKKRVNGLTYLRSLIGDTQLDYHQWGGTELFFLDQEDIFSKCISSLNHINSLLEPIFGATTFRIQSTDKRFKKVLNNSIFTPFEGQIDTGAMMDALVRKAYENGIYVLNNTEVLSFEEKHSKVAIEVKDYSFDTKKLCIATNGFSSLLIEEEVKPARAQVLITKPIPNLPLEGTYHIDAGFYYFRNIDNRILLGGGRNIDFEGEETVLMELNPLIQNQLDHILKEIILPNHEVEVDQRWTGIMGVGQSKTPLVKQLSAHVYCGIKLGGMGVAIGSATGNELANLI